MAEVRSWDEVPTFATEAEEDAFWSTHDLGEQLLEEMRPLPEGAMPPRRPRTRSIVLRLEQDVIERLEALARATGKKHQALLSELVVARLAEEERRAGLTPNR